MACGSGGGSGGNEACVQTTSDYYAVGSKKAQLKVATTQVKDSTLQQLPLVGQLAQDVKFPTREALEQVHAGTRTVLRC